MKKFIFAMICATLMVGCSDNTTVTVGDQKPVAPTTYQDAGSKTGDPQLPSQIPHWKQK